MNRLAVTQDCQEAVERVASSIMEIGASPGCCLPQVFAVIAGQVYCYGYQWQGTTLMNIAHTTWARSLLSPEKVGLTGVTPRKDVLLGDFQRETEHVLNSFQPFNAWYRQFAQANQDYGIIAMAAAITAQLDEIYPNIEVKGEEAYTIWFIREGIEALSQVRPSKRSSGPILNKSWPKCEN